MTDFRTIYWGEDRSTKVQFQPTSKAPQDYLVSSCFVIAGSNGQIVMSRPKRGWGLPGGRREIGETAEECVRREAKEEAGVELGHLTLIGQWEAKKRFSSDFNKRYPELSYQLLYVSDVTCIDKFTPDFEVSERAFVSVGEVELLHHNFNDFRDVFKFALESLSDRVAHF